MVTILFAISAKGFRVAAFQRPSTNSTKYLTILTLLFLFSFATQKGRRENKTLTHITKRHIVTKTFSTQLKNQQNLNTPIGALQTLNPLTYITMSYKEIISTELELLLFFFLKNQLT